jgi:tetratricopeptide (TPR) repeat protein
MAHPPQSFSSLKASPITRAADLRTLGYTSFRAGDFARARKHFERALALFHAEFGADHAETLTTLSDLGAACAALSDTAAARAAHEAALAGRRRTLPATDPAIAASLQNLGAVCRAQNDRAGAESCYGEALAIWRAALGDTHPMTAKSLISLAALARDRGDAAAAIAYATEALSIRRATLPPADPLIAASLDELATSLAQSGDHEGAQRHWEAALALLQQRPGARLAPLLTKLGMSKRQQRDPDSAIACFTAALRHDADYATARHNLAATLTRLGRHAEAKPHRDTALRQQNIFLQPGPAPHPAILILSISDDGNVPLDHLLPESAFTRIWWFIDHATNPLTTALPPYDIVFNAIGDPDMSAAADAKLAAFIANCPKPILNDPARVALTRRDRLPRLLHGIAGALVPPVVRIDNHPAPAGIVQHAAQSGLHLPLLLRPAGSHGGAGLLRIDDWHDLTEAALQPAASWYITPFHDCRAPDGYTRKYRAIFVNRKPYPYHLAISPHWLVHYFSADMEAHAWKLQEEAAFLENPEAALGATAYAALAEIGKRIDLDYCGIDFTRTPDGQLLVFEANATMLVHPESGASKLAYKNAAIGRITRAVRGLIPG